MRDAARAIIREVGVETGGSNIQFAVDPASGRMVVIEMNPRVSRSSALASKATGFPIAKIAALLAVGYTLDEIPNDITRVTPACLRAHPRLRGGEDPALGLREVPATRRPVLGTQMKSVGEVMAIGRTFKEALQKGHPRSLEIGRSAWRCDGTTAIDPSRLQEKLLTPNPERIFYIDARAGAGLVGGRGRRGDRASIPGSWTRWQQIVDVEGRLRGGASPCSTRSRPSCCGGPSATASPTASIALLIGWRARTHVRAQPRRPGPPPRLQAGGHLRGGVRGRDALPLLDLRGRVRGRADLATQGDDPGQRAQPHRAGDRVRLLLLPRLVRPPRGGATRRIMVNCNPETVSTDYDTSDRLYFEPLTLEDVLDIVELEKPDGRDRPVRRARRRSSLALPAAGAGRAHPGHLARRHRPGRGPPALRRAAARAGHPPAGERHRHRPWTRRRRWPRASAIPSWCGPPTCWAGGPWSSSTTRRTLAATTCGEAVEASPEHPDPAGPLPGGRLRGGRRRAGRRHGVVIGGILQHIEEAGVHCGDSACVLPPYKISARAPGPPSRDYTRRLGLALQVSGLMNVQYAIKDDVVYVLEVNPRASARCPS